MPKPRPQEDGRLETEITPRPSSGKSFQNIRVCPKKQANKKMRTTVSLSLTKAWGRTRRLEPAVEGEPSPRSSTWPRDVHHAAVTWQSPAALRGQATLHWCCSVLTLHQEAGEEGDEGTSLRCCHPMGPGVLPSPFP